MNPLFVTITFLSLMGILTGTSIKQYMSESFENRLYQTRYESSKKAEKILVKTALDDLRRANDNEDAPDIKDDKKASPEKKKRQGRRSSSLDFDLDRPPNNSRLNFYLLFFEPEKEEKNGFNYHSRYEIAARLLRNLYGSCPFFQQIPRLEYRLLDALANKKEQMVNFDFPDELAGVLLEDSSLQSAFQKMLKGGKEEQTIFPSLLHFITFDRKNSDGKALSSYQKKLNAFFICEKLLEATIGNADCAQKLYQAQKQLWDIILEQEIRKKSEPDLVAFKRSDLNEKIRESFKAILREYQLPEKIDSLFDFTLGKRGTIILIEEENGIVLREKLHRKS